MDIEDDGNNSTNAESSTPAAVDTTHSSNSQTRSKSLSNILDTATTPQYTLRQIATSLAKHIQEKRFTKFSDVEQTLAAERGTYFNATCGNANCS
jgi:hypothetical protein